MRVESVKRALKASSPVTARLYLDLLKATLTNTLFAREPDVNDESQVNYFLEFIDHYIKGGAISMCPLGRFDNIEACVLDVLEKRIPGDLIEAGVWRGGSTIFMRALLKVYGVTNRKVWVADSFEGLPAPNPALYPIEAKAHKRQVMSEVYNHFAVGLEDVRRNFRAFGMLDDQVHFLKGWFKDTLPAAPIEKLALIRLDGDYYESTRDGLVNLFDKLSAGGYVIVDDYGEESWTYCRQAVDEFRLERHIEDPMIRVDSKCYYWLRTR